MDGTFSYEPEPTRLPVPQRPVVPSAVLGTLIFIVSEVMFFAGTISAFTISRANQLPGMWPPPGQPRLPATATAINTVALLLSGLLLVLAYRLWKRSATSARWAYLGSWLLGATFVGLQGREWQALLAEGMTVTSSTLGSFFYLIVGGHAVHALGALLLLGWGGIKLWQGTLSRGWFFGTQAFWYFVVAMWPAIYARVYF